MACETCYAPSNWVPGEKLAAANESKREAFKELRKLRDDLAAERARAEREDEAHTRTIEQRDAFEEQIEAIYRALGGEGEWCAKLPPEDPPDSGDLGADALALAAAVIADRDRLRAAIEQALRRIKEGKGASVEAGLRDALGRRKYQKRAALEAK